MVETSTETPVAVYTATFTESVTVSDTAVTRDSPSMMPDSSWMASQLEEQRRLLMGCRKHLRELVEMLDGYLEGVLWRFELGGRDFCHPSRIQWQLGGRDDDILNRDD